MRKTIVITATLFISSLQSFSQCGKDTLSNGTIMIKSLTDIISVRPTLTTYYALEMRATKLVGDDNLVLDLEVTSSNIELEVRKIVFQFPNDEIALPVKQISKSMDDAKMAKIKFSPFVITKNFQKIMEQSDLLNAYLLTNSSKIDIGIEDKVLLIRQLECIKASQ